ncbi:DEAD/DEAH box helicase [Rummeliibacillus sp. POC4]|uniref:DEAD/DEAH box helicase n=1 Tax=Rummeliibacillus sp. POC4 TaxID=2305899 RepID=UPI001314A153|nr:DEAD/DEAH box helicase [Rummeliibacillus sp. POC4]
MKKLNIKYISEIIGNEHLTKWENGDVVIIKSQVGTGKTTFVLNDVLDSMQKDEKMLYLCNRKKLSRDTKINLFNKYDKEKIPKLKNGKINYQELAKIKWINNVKVVSYQSIGELLSLKKNVDLSGFKYIVSDECHMMISDSGFNSRTDLVFEKLIREDYPNSIRLFVSATMQEMEKPIKKGVYSGKSYTYDTDRDYSYLNVKYFKKHKDILQMVKNDKESDDKWLIFVASKIRGEEMEKELLKSGIDTVFVHSESRKDPIEDEKFKEKVLICTKVFDNGINIWDDQVKYLVINSFDETTFIQEIGRLRVDITNAREIQLYIPMTYINTWDCHLKSYEKKIEQIDLYNNSYEEFETRFNRNYDKVYKDIFYLDDGKWKINSTGHARLYKDRANAIDMVNDLYEDKYSYILEQLKWIDLWKGFETYKLIEDVHNQEEVMKLSEYLDGIVDKKLFSDEQQKLSDLIVKELLTISKNVDCRTKKLKPSTLETILREDLDLPYAVSKPKVESKGELRGKRYIKITKLK